jgi:hypothetical protein
MLCGFCKVSIRHAFYWKTETETVEEASISFIVINIRAKHELNLTNTVMTQVIHWKIPL